MEFTNQEIQIIKYMLDNLISDLSDGIDSDKLSYASHKNMIKDLKICNELEIKLRKYMLENSLEERFDVVDYSYLGVTLPF